MAQKQLANEEWEDLQIGQLSLSLWCMCARDNSTEHVGHIFCKSRHFANFHTALTAFTRNSWFSACFLSATSAPRHPSFLRVVGLGRRVSTQTQVVFLSLFCITKRHTPTLVACKCTSFLTFLLLQGKHAHCKLCN